MAHGKQIAEEADGEEQKEIEDRLRHTRIRDEILNEVKKTVIARMDYEEKNVPHWERGHWRDMVSHVISDVIRKKLPTNEWVYWTDYMEKQWTLSENDFLIEQKRPIREGGELTIDKGMFSNKIR